MYYLKYRPQTIAELDNSRIRETLGKALLSNNWAHAYLLTGTRGSGKTTTARLIAKIVNCTKRKKGEEPCNKCPSCQAITAGTSLDVIEIDAASNTGVDDIRDLREKVKLAPVSSKYKVYIIDEVHMLSNSAFNALLKTLEEPPENVIFVLATTDPQKLPATIVSRCLVYDFGQSPQKDIVSKLKKISQEEKLKVSEDVYTEIATRSHGSHRDAQKFLEQLAQTSANVTLEHVNSLNTISANDTARELISGLNSGKTKINLQKVADYAGRNGKIKDLINEMINYTRDIYLSRMGIEEDIDSIDITNEELNNILRDLIEAGSLVRESPVPELPLEMFLVKHSGLNTATATPLLETAIKPPVPVTETSRVIKQTRITSPSSPSVVDVTAKWPEILAAIKPFNNSLVALLRASRPKNLEGGILTLGIFYKFHKDKLSEAKNREIIEKVVSGIMGKQIEVKLEMDEKR